MFEACMNEKHIYNWRLKLYLFKQKVKRFTKK